MKHGLKFEIGSFLTVNFYILFAVSAYLSFKYDFPGFFRPLLWLSVVYFNYKKIRGGGLTNSIVFVYFFLGLVSILGCVQQAYPLEFFAVVLFESYIPIIFYFIGYNERSCFPVFYQRSVLAFSFIFIAGIFWLITTPDWYVSRQLEVLNQHGYFTEDTLMYARFASFLDSYHTSNFGVFLLCFSLGGLYYVQDNRKKILYSCTAILAFISIMLSQQRVAMYTSIIIVVYYVRLLNSFNSQRSFLFLAVILIFSIYGLSKIEVSNYVSIDSITGRFSSSSSSTMVSERSASWVYALDHQRNFVVGHGLGGGGHLAHAHGIKPAVRDGSYFKILLETGFFSLLCFVYIILSSMAYGVKKIKKYHIEFFVLLFCSLSLFGANIIDFPYIIAVMWYVLGRLSNTKAYI